LLLRDELHQTHVTRRIEKMDATKARAQMLRQGLRQKIDGNARGVACQNGVFVDERGNFAIEVAFDVLALGHRFNDKIAIAQFVKVVAVIAFLQILFKACQSPRRWLQFLQST
jgi:hypothetical protein